MAKSTISQRELINDSFTCLFQKMHVLEDYYLKQKGIKDLSSNELRILDITTQMQCPTMGDIAHRSKLSNGTITITMSKLEKKGYAQRIRDEIDKRIVRVKLTPVGLKAVRCRKKFFEELIDHACEDQHIVSDELLLNTLKKISEFFEGVKEEL
ncbi:MarR family winged helix-turn-helix transcriptional regulator [Kandleria vitulina]|uniref:MarR family winged helix-turn-helix transcriptional regulator n=1 Tax=Kandleria vitulina TaxID=1630 RepID=UPI000A582154|nr:MarR family transcriptional regulator [Kandleria vitulina]